MERLTWPDYLPGLVTWSGQMSLAGTKKRPGLIEARQEAVKGASNIFEATGDLPGVMGMDYRAAQSTLDVGFSPGAVGLAVRQRVGLELLAIVGVQHATTICYSRTEYGILHDGHVYRFRVERRGQGKYLKRWTPIGSIE